MSVLRVASGPRVKLASCKSALNPLVVYTTDRSKAVIPALVLLFVALWFVLRGDLLYVFPYVINLKNDLRSPKHFTYGQTEHTFMYPKCLQEDYGSVF